MLRSQQVLQAALSEDHTFSELDRGRVVHDSKIIRRI